MKLANGLLHRFACADVPPADEHVPVMGMHLALQRAWMRMWTDVLASISRAAFCNITNTSDSNVTRGVRHAMTVLTCGGCDKS